ncbi:MAG TPA: hypothetical protein VFM98_01845 [Ramlibacter sp.]|uniref:hypothetical protein n=1 Tax=Ramlibacter sp. TaxID=1917967 RepID=UPI002D802519|nr:hypothetical protein [Ramlibacter sp.]HET8744318.1 hypothetical protein [Ramlibacter sp.]
MSAIDPQEFGQLQAQVSALTEIVKELRADVAAMRTQMAEARGGWRVLMAIGGASSVLGGAATWLLTHFTGRGPT